MPGLDSPIRKGAGRGLDSPVGGGRAAGLDSPVSGSADPASAEDKVAALEAQLAEQGAGSFTGALKGLGGGVVEALLAPGYAVAGTAEELFSPKGGGISAAPGRFARELLSGLPGVEIGAERKGFAQVMEEGGVGALGNLSDIAPFLFSATGEGLALEKGGALDITGRGVIGTGLDVLTDPTTYVGTPASQFLRGSAKTGLRLAAKEVVPLIAEETARLSPHMASGAVDLARATARGRALAVQAAESVASKRAVAAAVSDSANELLAMGLRSNATDPLARELYGTFRGLVRKEAEDRVLAAAEHAPELLHRGGRTFMGKEIPGTVGLSAALSGASAPLTGYLAKTAPGRWALAASTAGKSLLDNIGKIAVPAWWIRHSPDMLEARANWRNMNAVIAGEGAARFEATGFHKLTDAGRLKVTRALEGAPLDGATQAEQAAYDGMRSLLDDMRTREIVAGVAQEAGSRPNYFPLISANTAEELALITRNIPNPVRRGSTHDITSLGRFNELRHFKTREDWIAYNAADRAATKGIPELKLLDETQSVLQRIHGHASSVAGKGYADEIASRFAVDVPKAAYDLTPSPLAGALKASEVREYLAITAAVAKGGTDLGFVKGLSDQGKSEFLRQRVSRATSDQEIANILRKYGDFAEHLPKRVGDVASTVDGLPMIPFDAFPELRGKLIPASLAFELSQSGQQVFKNPQINAILDRLDSINNFMRTTVYSIFPSSQFRNKYSNVATGAAAVGISYLDPRLQKDMLLLRYPKLRSILGDTGGITTRTGERYSWADLEGMFSRGGVYTTGRAAIEQAGTTLTKGPRVMHQLAGTLENQDRAALALHYLRSGKDITETARLVNRWAVDYTDLTAFDREILRRTFLFPTYARKMIPNIARAISETPGRMSNMVRLFRGRASENQEMTSWEGDAFKVRLDSDGRNLTVLTGVDLPIRQLDLLWRGSASRTALGAVGMMVPLIKAPLEVGFNTSVFTGRPFSRTESAAMGRVVEQLPASMRNWLGYRKDPDAAGRPKYTFDGQRFYMLFQSYALSRMLSTSDRQFREYLNDANWVGIMLDLGTGLRYKTINLDVEQQRKIAERLRLAEEASVRSGGRKEFRSTYVPKQQGVQ